VLIILALHFGQISHDRLEYSVNGAYPVGKAFQPGEIYATTVAQIMRHELHSGFGWRPNDFFLWGPSLMADNNANRQLGIIMAMRETVRVFKDDLTKVSSDEYDLNLVIADTDFRNDASRWILPSAESKYDDGILHLQMYVSGLHTQPQISRRLNLRNVDLIQLFQTWIELLGDAHAELYMTRKPDGSPLHCWEDDDYFYHAQGYAHVMYYMMQAVRREYSDSIKDDPVLAQLFAETIEALGQAAQMKPLIVLDGSSKGVVANHRHDLDAYICEALQKMLSIRDELARQSMPIG